MSANESKEALKAKLDFLASGTASITNIQEVLRNGPARTLTISPGSIHIEVVNSGSAFNWEISDPRTAVACLVASGEYEPLETQLLKQIAGLSKVVFDIGANVGYYSVELGKVMAPDGRLVAVEPVHDSFRQLVANIGLNGLDGTVRPINLGLSDVSETAQIFVPQQSGSSAASTRQLHPSERQESHSVEFVTLDTLFVSQEMDACDLIKIDVEGAEFLVLQGGKNTIEEFKPVIFAELLRKWSSFFSYDPNVVLEFLSELGYQCWGVSRDFRKITRFTEQDEETNFIFIHNSDKQNVVKLIDDLRVL